jgi:hypothetical protein
VRHDQGIRPTLTPKLRRVLIFLGVVAASGGVAFLTTFFGSPPRVEPPAISELAPDAHTADEFARLACVHVRLAGQGVQADAAAETVREELASARALATEALVRDPRFAGLSGGLAALDEAVRNDDAPAARIGLQVALNECKQLSP